MDRTRRNIYLTVLGVCIFMVTVVGLFVHRMLQPKILNREQLQQEGAYVFAQARPIPTFSLTAADGKPFTPADLNGHWSIVYFAYSHCPQDCRNTLTTLGRFEKRLLHTRYGVDTRAYVITVDPARDTPLVFRDYLRQFDPSLHGVTGAIDAIRKFAFTLNVAFDKQAGGGDSYTVAYTPNLILINPDGRYQGFFKPPFREKTLELLYVSARELGPKSSARRQPSGNTDRDAK